MADVQGLMGKFTISAGSIPTTTQAQRIIDEVSAEVDAHLLGIGVTVPVTAPAQFLGWLGLVNAYGATAAVLKSMFPAATGPAETPAYAFWEARYKAALKSIDDLSIIPGDVVATHRIAPSTYLTRNPSIEENLGDIAEPFFKRGKSF